ncbi:MAG: ABC transporter ATP-binding protein [Sulfuricellaceae bacterium]|nr:ABC transporter ATP-binding protein [Sulfuricellaceae bacterium]
MPIIEVNHVSKEYKLGQLTSLKQTILNQINRISGRPVEKRKPFKALDDINFSVEPGEVLGIIGHNGAGKSTLLKLLANIAKPSSGNIQVHGKVAPLIEVGAGLVADLTGRENIFINGAILGIPKKEIERKFDEIVAFAELEEFIDTPIKRYSSGMQVRLGFSIATSVESDILIVDEVLAVGDLAFQRKCFDRMEDMIRRKGKTVLLVSHNIRQVERLCSRVILLDHGAQAMNGNPYTVCNDFINRSTERIIEAQGGVLRREHAITDDLDLLNIELTNAEGVVTEDAECLKPLTLTLTIQVKSPLRRIAYYFGIHTTDFVYLTNNNTGYDLRDFEVGTHTISLTYTSLTLLPGVYSILLWIGTPEGKVSYYVENLRRFRVSSQEFEISRQRDQAIFYMAGNWNIPTGSASEAGGQSHAIADAT